MRNQISKFFDLKNILNHLMQSILIAYNMHYFNSEVIFNKDFLIYEKISHRESYHQHLSLDS